ncbi:outer membrane protein transport protein, partial [Vibrio makurazakiensis]|uniref:OmpP1/FadL family transporter n=1 Tax=Vibrio makurazakiensis TaxID=2910250 RepID=UPI003D0A5F76
IDPDVQVQFMELENKGLINSVYEEEAAPTALVPNVFYSRPINDKLTWGIGAYADFGLASDYSDEVNGTGQLGLIAGDTAVSVININNSIAYEVTETLTLGASASILMAHAEMNRYMVSTETPAVHMKGDGMGFSYKLGALYELNENHRFGIGYTAAVDVDLEGTFNGLDTIEDGGAVSNADGALTLNLPSITEISGYHQLTDVVAVHYSWVMIGWSAFQEIKGTSESCGTDGVCLLKEEEWKDSNRYSIGATGQLSDEWTVRIGWAKDETPTDEHITASIPDSERIWMTGGVSYQMDSHVFDFGIAYIKGEDGEVITENSGISDQYFRTEKSTAMIYSVQYAYNF